MVAFVQKNVNKDFSGTSATSIAVTMSAGGNGNHIEGFVTAADSLQTCQVSDNNGHNATMLPSTSGLLDSGNGNRAWMYYFENISAGPTQLTANFSVTCPFRAIEFCEHSGVATSSSLDGSDLANKASSSTPTSNSITTTANGDLIYSGVVPDSGNPGTITQGSGYTIRNNSAADVADETQVQGSAGSISASYTFGSAQATQIGIMAFKAAVTAAATAATLTMMGVG